MISFSFLFLVTATVRMSSVSGSSSDEKYIKHINDSRGHYVMCKVCAKYPDILKRYVHNNRIPSIATTEGARYRSTVLEHHFETEYHKESVKADRVKSLQSPSSVLMPLDVSINKANQLEANHVGKLLIQVYNDAKRLTLAAWNWPARYVTSEASNAFSITNENMTTIPSNVNLQYVNNKSHLKLMSCIVESDFDTLKSKIERCLSISLRVDGSIDKTHIDKIYVLAKIVTETGDSQLIFLGVSQQMERKASGLFDAALSAIQNQFGLDFLNNVILKKTSSICTDGANVNIGETGGMWPMFDKKLLEIGSRIPLLKVWCAAHRSDLAFKDLSSENSQCHKMLSILSGISSYFHTSPMRFTEMEKIAASVGSTILAMPKLFPVRWTEFTFQLFRAVLNNWHALAIYLRDQKDAKGKGFYKYLTNVEHLEKIAFFTDVLFIYKRFQKKLQSDSLTIMTMADEVNNVIKALENLKRIPIPSGFEFNLQAKLITKKIKVVKFNVFFMVLNCFQAAIPMMTTLKCSKTLLLICLFNFCKRDFIFKTANSYQLLMYS